MSVFGYVIIRDYSGETSRTTFSLPDINAANWTGVTQDLDEIADGIASVANPMIRGKVVDVGYTQSWPREDTAITDAEAQREKKWVVHYTDITPFLDVAGTIPNPGYGKRFTFEIATALLNGHMVSGSDEDLADMENADVQALVAVLTANVRSPYNNSGSYNMPDGYIRIDKITFSGRR